MREIKFRGKREKDWDWTYGLLAHDLFLVGKEKQEIVNHEIQSPLFDSDGYRGIQRYAVFTETVGQFTGLLDKNGKEIYEGDIVKWEYKVGYQMGIVDFDNRFGIIITERRIKGEWGENKNASWTQMLDYTNKVRWIVIGNIHDNPELLK